MTGLYLVPVDDSWLERFEETVESSVNLDSEDVPETLEGLREARIWGTTDEGQKRSYFQRMENGDPVLFYNNKDFIALGRVGQTFEDSTIGGWLWEEPASKFIFTITDFHKPGPSLSKVNQVLGYKETNIPMGFNRPSESALNNLLQTYNSIEEAFQDFKSTGGKEATQNEEQESVDEENTKIESPTEHTAIQWHLIQLGLSHRYDVYVAKNDRNREYNGRVLGEDCVSELNIAGFSDATLRIIEYVDVIWLKDDQIVEMFEVESTTSIYSGILRMTDFVVKVPNLAVSMNIVASSDDQAKVRREMNRPTFERALSGSEHSSLNFITFEEVKSRRDIVKEAGPLESVF